MVKRGIKDYDIGWTDEDIREQYNRLNERKENKYYEKECKIGLEFANDEYVVLIIKNEDTSRDKLIFEIDDKNDMESLEKILKEEA